MTSNFLATVITIKAGPRILAASLLADFPLHSFDRITAKILSS